MKANRRRETREPPGRDQLCQIASSLVYVDERLVVFNKAAGLSLATRRMEPLASAERLLSSIDQQESKRWGLVPEDLKLVHRLDSGTTGLVLAARDGATHRELTSAFQAREVDKIYLALVWGHPRPAEGRCDWPIGPDPKDRRRMRTCAEGKPAVTRYRTLARCRHVSLLELHPETGRTHQLRVHLAQAGHWIVGDDLYAGPRHRAVKDARLRSLLCPPYLLLHAWRLRLPESCTLGVQVFEAPLPAHFQTILRELGMEPEPGAIH